MAKIAEYKKKLVQEMNDLIRQYSIVGVVNMEGLPAQQLQAMRADLRDNVRMFMTKKRLIRIALDNAKAEKSGIEELEKHLAGMPALLLTKESPFKLSRILAKSKTKAPAKAGQIAPNDIVVPAGPTPFAPGPVISELSGAGLDVGVEGGKVAVKEDSIVAKKGDKISQKVAEVLTRLEIKPMTIGLDLVAAYEGGIIYGRDVLQIDEQQYVDNVNRAAIEGFNLAFTVTWIIKDNIDLFITKAFNDAKTIGLEQNLIDKGIITDLVGKAERSMLNLKSTANIEDAEKPPEQPPEKKEETQEESKTEEKSAEQKEAGKQETEKAKATEPGKEQEEKKESSPEQKQPPKEDKKSEEQPPEQKKEEVKEQPKEEPRQEKKETMPEEKREEKPQKEQKQKLQPHEKQEPEKKEQATERKESQSQSTQQKNQKQEKKAGKPEITEKEAEEMKQAEELAKELVKKGTLRK